MIGMNGEGLYFEIGKVYECSGTKMKAKVTRVNRETGKVTIVLCDSQGHEFTGKKHVANITWNDNCECECCYLVGADFSVSADKGVA